MTNETKVTWRICRHELPPYEELVMISIRATTSNWRGIILGWRGKTDKTGEHWQDHSAKWLDETVAVVAWAPLPKPSVEE